MPTRPDDEHQRFVKIYAQKYDLELQELALERDQLTDAARAALDEEIARRGLSALPPKTSGVPDPVSELKPGEVNRESKEFKRFAETYARKRDDEIETLARQRDSLLPVARAAFDDEFVRRDLTAETLDTTPGESAAATSDAIAANARTVDERPDPERMVIVERFRDLPPALIAKGFLDSAGIKSFLVDETMVRMDWLLSQAIGGVKLAVKQEDLEAAKETLAQGWESPIEFPDGETVPHPRCPQCNSPDVSYQALNKRASLPPVLVLNIPVRSNYPGWHCNHCGVLWEDTEGGGPLE
ncbi:MAG: hypothetical protein ABSC71_08895 [Candidatus Acidiferrales bacterium]|jgi:hypothetical protein